MLLLPRRHRHHHYPQPRLTAPYTNASGVFGPLGYKFGATIFGGGDYRPIDDCTDNKSGRRRIRVESITFLWLETPLGKT